MIRQDPAVAGPHRKATNVTLDTSLVAEARRLGLNLSRACEEGLIRQIAEEQGRIWKQENRKALESSNAFVERCGLPLSHHRQF